MAPGGIVVVWIQGDRFQTEVARFQAKETGEFDWHQKFPELRGTFDEYRQVVIKGLPKKIQQQIAAHNITYSLWDKWRQRYSWRPVFHVPGCYEIELSYFNKEREDIFAPQLNHVPYRQMAIPEKLDILWLGTKRAHMVTTVTFDEAEAFRVFGHIKPGQKADLTVNLDPAASTITIILNTGGQQYPFMEHKLATVITDQAD